MNRLLEAVLRTDLRFFIRKVFATVCPGEPYLHNWHIEAIAYYLLDVFRGRLEYPELRRKVIALAREHACDRVLIEDAGPGMKCFRTSGIRRRQERCARLGFAPTAASSNAWPPERRKSRRPTCICPRMRLGCRSFWRSFWPPPTVDTTTRSTASRSFFSGGSARISYSTCPSPCRFIPLSRETFQASAIH
jgi:hypothetical protein